MSLITRRLLAWYAKNGRAQLPWRVIRSPYFTVVSEFMLQQTQVDRVVPIFETFVSRFPNFASLAKGPQSEVMRYWKGLGYNTRAVRLKALANAVVAQFDGEMPTEEKQLLELPGVGPYTVAAIRAFAFNYDNAP
ncbi:MAG TPA: A/G-specific adenine glycosylase, partial [Candidatus Dormibacteraeota bacterium]|nr:A/G-specific adenine glycosylase [Candidatus Dormibacteraeota bacterium]